MRAPGFRTYWTVELLPDLPDPVVDQLQAPAVEPSSAPLIFCVAWGGAAVKRRSASAASASPGR